ncbi:AGC family protein kinase [Histomonas meleagridis]|uniref:AGC family protein kinase n=1 Tax=Histomonas meleagridis TaxID=135588 RepID=UPI00355A7A3B|nr:AGC family protein kinase [Histomonas meleagridis]KAH0803750.1 AGC family protein kinase [Histomonas meleagridis]
MENNQNSAPSPKPQRKQKRRDDFNLGKLLGHGAFGQVLEVTDKETGKKFAMKVLSKAHIVRENKMQYVKVERDVMTKLNHPNVIKLCLTFQDPGNLYYVIEYAQNGDLQKVLEKVHTLEFPCIIHLAGQILLGLAHIHKHRIIHRDLKPENILLDGEYRAKITDFGTAKMFAEDQPFYVEKGSFVGSADYVCPETLVETPVGPASDLWSYGCILYRLIVGQPPFHSNSMYETFQRIQALDFKIPENVPEDAKDLIQKLIVLEPSKRLGEGEYDSDYESIRNHPFFSGVDWESLPLSPTPNLNVPADPDDEAETAEANDTQPPTPPEPSKPPEPSDQPTETHKTSEPTHFNSVKKTKVPELLSPDEDCIFEEFVTKQRHLSFKHRLLVLTTKGRLIYVDTEAHEIKGQIPIFSDTNVVISSNPKKWSILVGKKREYKMSSEDPASSGKWKKLIEEQKERMK